MSLTSQRLFTNSSSRISLYYTATGHSLKNPSLFSLPVTCRRLTTTVPVHFHVLTTKSDHDSKLLLSTRRSRLIRVYDSEGVVHRNDNSFNVDSFLSIAELICLVSSAILTIGFAANYAVSGWRKAVLGVLGERVLVWGVVMMVGSVLVGALIRRRQWSRVCMESVKGGAEKSFNLVERIEKMEEDVKSLATIVRVLSRKLEKLGIRFRVTRRSLKDPISEAAVLAQKNSEATRALALQEDILEKELGEVQKVLLAMQDQQLKQLELILAIGKSGKLLDDKPIPEQEHDRNETHESDEGVKQIETSPKSSSGRGKK